MICHHYVFCVPDVAIQNNTTFQHKMKNDNSDPTLWPYTLYEFQNVNTYLLDNFDHIYIYDISILKIRHIKDVIGGLVSLNTVNHSIKFKPEIRWAHHHDTYHQVSFYIDSYLMHGYKYCVMVRQMWLHCCHIATCICWTTHLPKP